jgi:putative sigma-54 modulation protein
MQLNLTGHHVEITPPMREYINEKLQKLERHFDHVTHIHCILTVEKLRHKAEARVNLSGGSLFADASVPEARACWVKIFCQRIASAVKQTQAVARMPWSL